MPKQNIVMNTKTVQGVNVNLDAIKNLKDLQKADFWNGDKAAENEAAIELGFVEAPKEKEVPPPEK